MSHHLVVGAGGIGRATASALTRAGHDVTLLTRSGTDPHLPGVRAVAGDAASVASVTGAARGAASIVNAVNPRKYTRWARDWPPVAAIQSLTEPNSFFPSPPRPVAPMTSMSVCRECSLSATSGAPPVTRGPAIDRRSVQFHFCSATRFEILASKSYAFRFIYEYIYIVRRIIFTSCIGNRPLKNIHISRTQTSYSWC